MRKYLLSLAIAVVGLGGLVVQPASALDFKCPEDKAWAECVARVNNSDDEETLDSSAIDPTFVVDVDSNDSFGLTFGNNKLSAGNNFIDNTKSKGLLFSFGNNLNQKSESEYLFTAGNNVTFAGKTTKDLFAAGNNIQIKSNARIGGYVYATGNTILLETDLSGDFSAAAGKVIIGNVTIGGNVNLTADNIIFQEGAKINGTLVYNDTANVTGLDQIKVTNTQTYTPESKENQALVFWIGQALSACSIFVALLLIVLVFSRTKERIITATEPAHLGRIILSGIAVSVLVPMLAIFLIMSYVASITGVILIVIYIILIYLAKAFAGAYFGHLIISKLFRSKNCPFLLEAAAGIVLIILLGMVPYVSILVGLVTTIIGLGVMATIIRHRQSLDSANAQPKKAPQVIAAKNKTVENPFRNAKTTTSSKPKSKKTSANKK